MDDKDKRIKELEAKLKKKNIKLSLQYKENDKLKREIEPRIEQLERELAEACQREEDAVSQHDTLRDQRDAERALADQIYEALFFDRTIQRYPAITAYRKARGLDGA